MCLILFVCLFVCLFVNERMNVCSVWVIDGQCGMRLLEYDVTGFVENLIYHPGVISGWSCVYSPALYEFLS